MPRRRWISILIWALSLWLLLMLRPQASIWILAPKRSRLLRLLVILAPADLACILILDWATKNQRRLQVSLLRKAR